MKKNFLIVISMMIVAFLATSCGPKTPNPVLLGDGSLMAYAVLDKSSETFLWGVRENKSGIAKIQCVFTAPPQAQEEFFIGETADKKIIFDKTGKILLSGADCFINKLADGEKFIISRTDGEGEKAYMVAHDKTIGPKEKLFISDSQIYYRQDDKLGILSHDNREILQGMEKIYVVKGKVKKNAKAPTYYLCKDNAGYKLYNAEGKVVRKMSNAQALKYLKDAVDDPALKGLYSSKVAY